MPDRLFSSLASRVNASVPGCPQPTIVQYVRDSAIRTCERTLGWRYEVPKFTLLPGVHEYLYNKPTDSDVHALFEVLVNDKPLAKLTLEQAIDRYPEWADLYNGADPWALTSQSLVGQTEYNEALFNEGSLYQLPDAVVDGASEPRVICQVTPDKYILLPLPDDQTYTVRMWLALKPKRTAIGMDEVIFNELEDAILHGALQHLLVLPNAHWTDRELATYHAKQYLFHLSERRARANLGNMRGTMMARMQPFS